MNEKRGGGINPRLLLLIPATMMVLRHMHRTGLADRHGHRRWAEGTTPEGDATGSYRLPPKIERILASWHERAHRAADSADAAEAPTT